MKMNIAVVIASLLSVLGGLDLTEAQRCSIRIKSDVAERAPLVMWPGVRAGFAYPEDRSSGGSIILGAKKSLRLVCLGTGNSFAVNGLTSASDVKVSCVNGLNFTFDGFGITKQFEDIACSSYPASTARKTSGGCWSGPGIRAEIGFDVAANDFQSLITVCHDNVKHNTIVAHAKILAVIDAAQTSSLRPAFAKGGFYNGISMDQIYQGTNQLDTLTGILGSKQQASKYWSKTDDNYWAKGHLVAKADFIYVSQQRSTFYYLNTVPMWQNVNNRNWRKLEASVKELATSRDLDLDVYTGSMGVLTLPDVKGVQQEVYLSVKGNQKSVPVPKLLFKVVYADDIDQGIVFLTANNPHLTKLTSDYVKCTDVCDKIKSYRLSWKPKEAKSGLSYCCKIDDFRRAFPNLPSFPSTKLLV